MSFLTSEYGILLFTTWLAFFFAAISPGPNMLAVMERAFGSGRKAAVGVAIGIATGSFFWAITTIFGVSLLSRQFSVLVPLFSLVGGGYLINIGILRYRSIKSTAIEPNVIPIKDTLFVKSIAHGLIVIVSNPKVGIFWVSMATVIAKTGYIMAQYFCLLRSVLSLR